jgi:amino acid adenylation domain-containing protein
MSDLSKRISALSPEQRAVFERRLQQQGLSLHKLQAIPRRTTGDAPLSFAQERLWFLHQLAPDSPVYNGPSAVQLSGLLDVAALQRSLNELVRRHETLRTSFVLVDEWPLQRIAPPQPMPLPILDIRALPPRRREAVVQQLIAAAVRQPFDLAAGSLARALLLRLDATEHILLFTMHHIISDGWSTELLVQEVAALYEAFATGKRSPLAELPIQYADYAIWQREWLQGEVLNTQLAYWRENLAGAPPLLDLPTDRPRPAVQRFQGAVQAFALPDTLHAPLAALSQHEGATLFMTMLAAFQVVLARYSGQDDILVGSPVANRARTELSGLIGFFANNLVFRSDLSGDLSFRALLWRVRAGATSAYAHPDLPFELLVKELNPDRTLSYAPIFQVAFNLQRVLVPTLERANVTLRPLTIDNGTAKLDINLFVWEADGRLSGSIEYNTDLFDATTIARMAAHFQALLLGIAADPDRPIAELPLLRAAERQLLVEWNATDTAYPDDLRLHQLVSAQVARTPDAVALVFDETNDESRKMKEEVSGFALRPASFVVQLTYAELDRRADQLAQHLRGLGVGPEVVVGMCVARSLELVVGLLGILKAGGAYLPIDPDYPPERRAFMLQDSQARVLISYSIDDLRLTIDDLQHPDNIIVNRQSENIHPDNLAYVIYTSGSTGQPKGALNTHRGIVNRLLWMQARYGLAADDCVLQKTPFSFDVSVWEFFWPLLAGARLVVAPPDSHKDSAYLVRVIAAQQITTLHFVPSMLHVFLEERGLERCGSLRRVLCSGEALTVELQERFFARLDAELHNLYGPTEAAVDVSAWQCAPAADPLGVPIGRPIANTQLYLLDRRLNPVPVGVPGDLYIGGVQLARGYLKRPDLTAERFIPNPFGDCRLQIADCRLPMSAIDYRLSAIGYRLYATGDLARYRPDGAIIFLGRVDHQVKLRGFRIELDEITAVLHAHPAVRETVVLAREDAPGDSRLVAYIVLTDDEGRTTKDESAPSSSVLRPSSCASELRAFLAARLPEYMIPAAFVLLDALPLTPNGKLDRRALPAPDSARLEPLEAHAAPRGPIEELLSDLWRQLLGVEQIGRDESFFALGGHSLLAARLIVRIRDVLQVEISVRSIFESPTIAGMAAYVEAARLADALPPASALLPQPRNGRPPLSFAQQRLWFLDQLEHGNAAYNIPAAVRLEGALDIAALGYGLNAIIRRHEALRTTFASVAGQPVQVIAPSLVLALPLLDLHGLPDGLRDAASRGLITGSAAQPFVLDRGPLIRAALLRLGEQSHILLLTVHHSVSDGWSLGVFVRELAVFYAAQVAGEPAALPALPIQYADFAIWQRTWLQGERVAAPLAYWRNQLTGVPPLALPTDHPRLAVPRFRGALRWFSLPLELSEALDALSRREGVTLFMTLLATFQTLLARYSGQTDITVGSPIAGRTQIETEPLIGFFVNTLVLRADLSGDPTVRELLHQVRDVTLDAYTHQELPFEMLVEDLQLARASSRTPLFQVMMILQNAPMPPLELTGLTLQLVEAESSATKFDLTQLTGLTLQLVEAESGAAKFDLTLSMQESDHGLIGMMEYSTDLFEPPTIARILGHFQRMLTGIAADPTQHLSMLPLLAAAERQQLIVEWNATQAAYPRGTGLHQLIEAQAAQTPDAVAMVFSADQYLTYAELNQRANQLAHTLQQRGVAPDQCVAIAIERSLELLVGLLGVLKAGAAYLPLDPTYPAARLQYMLEESRAAVLLTTTNLHDTATQGQGDTEIAQLLVALSPRLAIIVDLIADWSQIARQPTHAPRSSVAATNLAYVIYTSGSTGRPKGVAITHDALVNQLHAMRQAPGLNRQDVLLSVSTITFDIAGLELFLPLLCGARVELVPRAVAVDGRQLAARLAGCRATLMQATPATWRMLIDAGWPGSPQLTILCGAEALPRELADQLLARSRALWNLYGPTETTIWSVVAGVASGADVVIGRPITNMQIYLLDAALRPVPLHIVGEIYIGGSGLARGYLQRPDLTAERFVPTPFLDERRTTNDEGLDSSFVLRPSSGTRLYKTGDLGRYRTDGMLEYLGRIDGQVKLRGFRIELGEIEAVLRSHPSVREVAVLAREDVAGEPRLVAYVVQRAGESSVERPISDPQSLIPELRDYVKTQLPEYMVPATIVLMERLPQTSSGKLNRQALPAPDYQAGLASTYVAPRTQTEAKLAALWAELLDLTEIGVYDNFFDLGGHSLLATRVLAHIQEIFDVQLPLAVVFTNFTIAELGKQIAQRQITAAPAEEVATMIEHLDTLSDAEVEQLLASMS